MRWRSLATSGCTQPVVRAELVALPSGTGARSTATKHWSAASSIREASWIAPRGSAASCADDRRGSTAPRSRSAGNGVEGPVFMARTGTPARRRRVPSGLQPRSRGLAPRHQRCTPRLRPDAAANDQSPPDRSPCTSSTTSRARAKLSSSAGVIVRPAFAQRRGIQVGTAEPTPF